MIAATSTPSRSEAGNKPSGRRGPDDPGSGNWLDTKGRTETILLARYLLPSNELSPITTNLINI